MHARGADGHTCLSHTIWSMQASETSFTVTFYFRGERPAAGLLARLGSRWGRVHCAEILKTKSSATPLQLLDTKRYYGMWLRRCSRAVRASSARRLRHRAVAAHVFLIYRHIFGFRRLGLPVSVTVIRVRCVRAVCVCGAFL